MAGRRGHDRNRGPALPQPSRRRPDRAGPRGVGQHPARPPQLGRFHAGDAGRAHAAPRRAHGVAQGRRGPRRARPDGAPRPRRRARALPAARALRQPHPRHRLRRPTLSGQAGRGPQLGRGRVSHRAAAGAGQDEPLPAGGARTGAGARPAHPRPAAGLGRPRARRARTGAAPDRRHRRPAAAPAARGGAAPDAAARGALRRPGGPADPPEPAAGAQHARSRTCSRRSRG